MNRVSWGYNLFLLPKVGEKNLSREQGASALGSRRDNGNPVVEEAVAPLEVREVREGRELLELVEEVVTLFRLGRQGRRRRAARVVLAAGARNQGLFVHVQLQSERVFLFHHQVLGRAVGRGSEVVEVTFLQVVFSVNGRVGEPILILFIAEIGMAVLFLFLILILLWLFFLG